MRQPVTGTIVALGGGGFSVSGAVSPIDGEILAAATLDPKPFARGRLPRVCLLPTASGDDSTYVHRFEAAWSGVAETSVCSLFTKDDGPSWFFDPHRLLDQDVIYVGGGSTANLLALWRLHGVPELLVEAASNGTVLAGISAGANCWFEASSTDSFGPLAPLDDGLGLLPGSLCPHLFGEPGRETLYRRWVAAGLLPDGYGVDDHVALFSQDGQITHAISERIGHRAVRVEHAPDQPTGTLVTPVVTLVRDPSVEEEIATLTRLLAENDPLSFVALGAPPDEYEPEARGLASELPECADPDEVANHLFRIFGSLVGEVPMPGPDGFGPVAEAIFTNPVATSPSLHSGRGTSRS